MPPIYLTVVERHKPPAPKKAVYAIFVNKEDVFVRHAVKFIHKRLPEVDFVYPNDMQPPVHCQLLTKNTTNFSKVVKEANAMRSKLDVSEKTHAAAVAATNSPRCYVFAGQPPNTTNDSTACYILPWTKTSPAIVDFGVGIAVRLSNVTEYIQHVSDYRELITKGWATKLRERGYAEDTPIFIAIDLEDEVTNGEMVCLEVERAEFVD